MIQKENPAVGLLSNVRARVSHGFNTAVEAIGKVENLIVVNKVMDPLALPQPRAERPCLSHCIIGSGITCTFRLAGRTTGCSVRVAEVTGATVVGLGRKAVGVIKLPWRKRGQTRAPEELAQPSGAISFMGRVRTRRRIRRLKADLDKAHKSMAAALASVALARIPKALEDEQVQKDLAAIRASGEQIRELSQPSHPVAKVAPISPAVPWPKQTFRAVRAPQAPEPQPSVLEAPKRDASAVTAATPAAQAKPESQVPARPVPTVSVPLVVKPKAEAPASAPVQPLAPPVEVSAAPKDVDVGMEGALDLGDLLGVAKFEFSSDRLLFENAIRCARSEDTAACEMGVRTLEKLEGPVVTQALVILSQHPEDTVRAHALDALLERPGSPALFPVLQKIVRNDPSARARIAAIRVLFKLNPVQSIPYLRKAVSDENAMVRRRAVMCLTWAGAQEAIPDLIFALEDPDVEVRRATVQALGQLRSKVTIPYLIKGLDDSDLQVRESVWHTLQTLTGQNLGFKPRGSSETRGREKANWENWWAQNESEFSL